MAVVPVYVLAKEYFRVPVPALFTFKVLLVEPPLMATVVKFKVSFAPTLIVSLLLAVASSAIPPDRISVLLPVTASLKMLPFFKLIALEIVSAALPLKVKVAPLFTVTALVPNPLLLAVFSVPPATSVVPAYVFAKEVFKVPVPVLFTFNVLFAEPPLMATVVRFKVSFEPTLIVSLLLAVASKAIPPERTSVLLPVTASLKVLPFFKLIALEIVNAALPLKAKVPVLFTVTALVPRPLLFAIDKTPALIVVLPV